MFRRPPPSIPEAAIIQKVDKVRPHLRDRTWRRFSCLSNSRTTRILLHFVGNVQHLTTKYTKRKSLYNALPPVCQCNSRLVLMRSSAYQHQKTYHREIGSAIKFYERIYFVRICKMVIAFTRKSNPNFTCKMVERAIFSNILAPDGE